MFNFLKSKANSPYLQAERLIDVVTGRTNDDVRIILRGGAL